MWYILVMNPRLLWILVIAAVLTVAGCLTCHTFDTKFAELTIDWFAFVAGIYLVAEAAWQMATKHGPLFPDQFLRLLRAIIGVSVFTIHLLQFMRM